MVGSFRAGRARFGTPAPPHEEGEQDMTLNRRNAFKLCGALVVALCLALSGSQLLAQSGKVEVHWLGQATFKITTPGGKVIVIDPFVTGNPKTPADQKAHAKHGTADRTLDTHR